MTTSRDLHDAQGEGIITASEIGGIQMETPEQEPAAVESTSTKKNSKQPIEATEVERQPGKTLLPFARVQKIIKADKDIPIVAREATFLISVATEEFIKRLTEAAQQVAQKERRTTVQHRDLATVVRRADEFLFLEDILPWTSSDPPAKRPKPTKTLQIGKGKESVKDDRGPTLLDKFVGNKDDTEEGTNDVVMNEDGTMYAANTGEFDE